MSLTAFIFRRNLVGVVELLQRFIAVIHAPLSQFNRAL
jgi:hypothetical protein